MVLDAGKHGGRGAKKGTKGSKNTTMRGSAKRLIAWPFNSRIAVFEKRVWHEIIRNYSTIRDILEQEFDVISRFGVILNFSFYPSRMCKEKGKVHWLDIKDGTTHALITGKRRGKCSNLFEQWRNAMRDGRRGDKRFRRFNVTRYFPTRILIVVSSWERTMVSINHAPRCLQLRWDYKLVEMIPPDLRPCNTYICYVRGRISWGNAQYCTKKFQRAKWDSNRLLNCIYLLFD